MGVTKGDLAEGRFYLARDGAVVRQADFLWNGEMVSYREFEADSGHPVRFHQTCTTRTFLAWAGRVMSVSETVNIQVAEADRLQEMENERRWASMLEHIPDERLVGELGRRGYRTEVPPKRNPLAALLTVHFQVKDGKFEAIGPMTDADRAGVIEEARAEAVRRGPLAPTSLASPLRMSMGGRLFEIDGRICHLHFSLIRSGTTSKAEHLLIEPAGLEDSAPIGDKLIGHLVLMAFGSDKGIIELPAMTKHGSARQFVRPLPRRRGAAK